MFTDFSARSDAPVLVIGAAGVDMVGRLKGELNPGTSNPAQIRSSFGGVARNVAENLARLGQRVRLLTVVGIDQPGEQLLQEVQAAGVDITAVARTDEHPTGTYLAIVNAAGELQTALDDMRAVSLISPEYIQVHADLLAESSAVFIDANLPKETLRTVISMARKARLPICADPTSAGLAPKLKPYIKHLALITPNLAEAVVLTDRIQPITRRREAIEAAKDLVGMGAEIAIVSLAAFGACYATPETSGHVPRIRTTTVDPTGAGDSMTATVLYALLNDIPIDDAVRLGMMAASLTLRHRGAVLPDLSLEKLYDELS